MNRVLRFKNMPEIRTDEAAKLEDLYEYTSTLKVAAFGLFKFLLEPLMLEYRGKVF